MGAWLCRHSGPLARRSAVDGLERQKRYWGLLIPAIPNAHHLRMHDSRACSAHGEKSEIEPCSPCSRPHMDSAGARRPRRARQFGHAGTRSACPDDSAASPNPRACVPCCLYTAVRHPMDALRTALNPQRKRPRFTPRGGFRGGFCFAANASRARRCSPAGCSTPRGEFPNRNAPKCPGGPSPFGPPRFFPFAQIALCRAAALAPTVS
jgi:hypothetical protein